MPEGLWQGQFNIVAGGVSEEGPYAATVPDRTVAESVADLFVAIQPTQADTDKLCGELVETMGRVFGRSQYSVTGNLLLAMGKAHQHLRDWNRASLAEHRLGVGITSLAVKDNQAYVAQAGPAAAFYRHNGHVERLEPLEPEAKAPLGEADLLAPSFHHLTLEPGDGVLLLSGMLAARLDSGTIDRCLSLDPDDGLAELYRAAQRERDCGAVLLAVQNDLRPADHDVRGYGARTVGHAPSGTRTRALDEPLLGEEPLRRRPPSPLSRNPFRKANAMHPDHGGGVLRLVGAEKPRRPRTGPKNALSTPDEVLAAAAAVAGPTKQLRIGGSMPSFRGPFSSLGGHHSPGRWTLAGAGVLALVLAAWFGVPALLNTGRTQQFQSLLHSAQTEFASAQTESDLSRRRELLNQALSNADEAKHLKPSDPRATTQASTVQDAISVMDAVYTLPDVPALADLSSAGLGPSSAVEVAAGDRYYVLDVAAGKVFSASRDPQTAPEVVYEDGSQIDGVRAGKAHHIAWQPPSAGDTAGTLLILDAGRHLFGLTNNDLRGVPLRGVDQWRADTAMAFAGGSLYLLDAPAGLVWRYSQSDTGFDTDPAPAVARADIRDAGGISVVGGIFLTGQDSRIRRFLDGQEGPFKLAGIDKAPASPQPPLFDPASGLLYIADRANSRIVVLEGDGRFKRQLVHQRLAGLRGAAVDSQNSRLVGVIGQSLVQIPLPK